MHVLKTEHGKNVPCFTVNELVQGGIQNGSIQYNFVTFCVLKDLVKKDSNGIPIFNFKEVHISLLPSNYIDYQNLNTHVLKFLKDRGFKVIIESEI